MILIFNLSMILSTLYIIKEKNNSSEENVQTSRYRHRSSLLQWLAKK